MTRKELAAAYHGNRCNCCQAVVCAFHDVIGIDEETAKELARPYGVGAYNNYCGSVMGMCIVANMLHDHKPLQHPAEVNEETKEYIEPLIQAFENRNTSVYCSELKGKTTGKVLRSCRGCVEDCAEILAEALSK